MDLTQDRDTEKVRRVMLQDLRDHVPEEELGPSLEKPEPIKNQCLSCDKWFKAPTKFHRLCDTCRKNVGRMYLPQYEGW